MNSLNETELDDLNKLAKSIKKHRLMLKITQEKLAILCGFDRTYISMLERSKRNPSYLNLKRLCRGLGISILELLS